MDESEEPSDSVGKLMDEDLQSKFVHTLKSVGEILDRLKLKIEDEVKEVNASLDAKMVAENVSETPDELSEEENQVEMKDVEVQVDEELDECDDNSCSVLIGESFMRELTRVKPAPIYHNKASYLRFQGGHVSSLSFYTWTDLSLRHLFITRRFTRVSPTYFFPEYNFRLCIRLVQEMKKKLSLILRFETADWEQEEVDCPSLTPCIYVVIRARKCPNVVRWVRCKHGDYFRYNTSYHNILSIPQLERTLGLSKFTAKLDIHVEQPSASARVFSYDGVLEWSVSHYKKVKAGQARSESVGELSPYFYTDPRGYRVQVCVGLTNRKRYRKKDVSFEIAFLNGPYDEWLTGLYFHRTTVTIEKKSQPGRSISKSAEVNLKERSSYVINVGNYEEVEEFVDRDEMHYKVVIVGIATMQRKESQSTETDDQSE